MALKPLHALPMPLKRLRQGYRWLQKAGFTCSLLRLIDDPRHPLRDYCRPFRPHPDTEEIIRASREFCSRYGIWLPGAEHYITCQLFLYPEAGTERILYMTWNNAVDYYCNDTMGRDLFNNLSPAGQEQATAIIARMAALDERLEPGTGASDLEQANAQMLRQLKRLSPPAWFRDFLQLYNHHLAVTHRCTIAPGEIPTVDEYRDMRYHTSGMPHIVLLLEFAENNFLDRDWLSITGLTPALERLHYLVAAFGALSNDLFSFEKEVIDAGTEANLLAVIALGNPQWHLTEVILRGAALVRGILREYFSRLGALRKQVAGLLAGSPEQARSLDAHLDSIERAVQASWMWQVHTRRYKRPMSLFEETGLQESPVAKAV